MVQTLLINELYLTQLHLFHAAVPFIYEARGKKDKHVDEMKSMLFKCNEEMHKSFFYAEAKRQCKEMERVSEPPCPDGERTWTVPLKESMFYFV